MPVFFQKYPWTDAHQLNLNWLLKNISKLKGGNKGEVLIKNSNTDFDFTWVPTGDFQVLNTINEIGEKAVKDYVLVLENNSRYGDGGPCWFKVSDRWTHHGWQRPDGRKMYPVLDQGPMINNAAPMQRIMGIVNSYVERDPTVLVYGNEYTLFEDDAAKAGQLNPDGFYEIDCCAFVSAVLNGVPWEASKYTTTPKTNTQTAKISDYAPQKNVSIGGILASDMAQYMGEHKWLHKMPTSANVGTVLQPGDVLFFDSKISTTDIKFLDIGHTAIVVGVCPSSSWVVIAQAGRTPNPSDTSFCRENSNTVCKFTSINLTDQNITDYVVAFGRIPMYTEEDETALPLASGLSLKPVFIPNMYLDSSHSGKLAPNFNYYATPEFIKVEPGKTIKYTGQISTGSGDDLREYNISVAEYDENYQFITQTSIRTNPKTLNSKTKYIRLQFGMGTSTPVLLTDIANFEAVILITPSDLGFKASYIEHLLAAPVLIGTSATSITFTHPLSDYDLILFSCFNNTSAVGTLIFNGNSRDSAIINGLKLTNSGTERTMTITIAADKETASGIMSGGSYSLDVYGIKF